MMSEELPIEKIEDDSTSFDSNTPITGQTKMQAAWSTNNDLENNEAQVATTQQGQIFEQIYRPWEGQLNPRWMRNWSILRHHILGIFKKGHRPWNIPTKLFIFFVIKFFSQFIKIFTRQKLYYLSKGKSYKNFFS